MHVLKPFKFVADRKAVSLRRDVRIWSAAQEFAARTLAQLIGPEGDAGARAVVGSFSAVPALLQLLERGSDKGAVTNCVQCLQ